MSSILSKQPFKALATVLFLVASPPYLTTLSVLHFTKLYRPISTWSLRTTLAVAFLRFYFKFASAIRIGTFNANAAKLKDRYVLVEPGPSELYKGVLSHPIIKPAAVPAVWFPEPLSNSKTAKVVIHFQGGAFVTASDPEETGTVPSKRFASTFGATTLWAQYRVARDEGTRFPAALQDAVTFYNFILEKGVDPSNVIVSGDSAGGNLVIGLLRYLEETKLLPMPRGSIACAPWVDISKEAMVHQQRSKRLKTDFIPVALLRWGIEAYEASPRSGESEPYLSPLHHPFRISVPLFVNVGTAELLYDEVKLWVERMRSVEGNQVVLDETKDAPHDVLLAGDLAGFGKNAESLIVAAAQFFDDPTEASNRYHT